MEKRIGRKSFIFSFIELEIFSSIFAYLGFFLSIILNKFFVVAAVPSLFFQLCLYGAFNMRAQDFLKNKNEAACFSFFVWGLLFLGGCFNFWSAYFLSLYENKEIIHLPFFVSEQFTIYFNVLNVIGFLLLLVFACKKSRKSIK